MRFDLCVDIIIILFLKKVSDIENLNIDNY